MRRLSQHCIMLHIRLLLLTLSSPTLSFLFSFCLRVPPLPPLPPLPLLPPRQVPDSALQQSLRESVHTIRGEAIHVFNSVQQAEDVRDALGKALYSRTFDWLVSRVNQSMRVGPGGGSRRWGVGEWAKDLSSGCWISLDSKSSKITG